MKRGWKTFETPPKAGTRVDVYAEDDTNGTWIYMCEWDGTTLTEIGCCAVSHGARILLWRPQHPAPPQTLIDRAKTLPIVPSVDLNIT